MVQIPWLHEGAQHGPAVSVAAQCLSGEVPESATSSGHPPCSQSTGGRDGWVWLVYRWEEWVWLMMVLLASELSEWHTITYM